MLFKLSESYRRMNLYNWLTFGEKPIQRDSHS